MNRWAAILPLLLAGCSPQRSEFDQGLFTDVAAATGLQFVHVNGAEGHYYLPEIMGAGGALLDYDCDGDLDVYLVQGGPLAAPPQDGTSLGNRLFRNELIPGGSLQFTDVTAGSGAGLIGYGMGAAVGDYDNDGLPDIYVTNLGTNVLLHNEGGGKWTDVSDSSGTRDVRWSTSAAFLDYNLDGWLDLFVANYVDFTVGGNRRCHSPAGELDYCTPRAYGFETDRLFRNRRDGSFADASSSSGAGLLAGPGLGAAMTDVDRDGWPDIFVANDSAANFLWRNRSDGTFEEQGVALGLAYAEDGMAKAGMGIAPGDFDNDGDEDFVVVNLTGEGATLFRCDSGAFTDASLRHRVALATSQSTGFGTGWIDYNNDGLLDLFIANGAVTTLPDQRGNPHPFEQRAVLLRNPGSGQPFLDVTAAVGRAMQRPGVGRGAAFGDIDNDGDLDILVTTNNGPVRLYRNDTASRGNWVIVQLIGVDSNRMGLGAEVGVFRNSAPPLWRRVRTDSSYLSAGDSRVHFGLGRSRKIERVEVRWPGGSMETFNGVQANQIVTLTQGSSLHAQVRARAVPPLHPLLGSSFHSPERRVTISSQSPTCH